MIFLLYLMRIEVLCKSSHQTVKTIKHFDRHLWGWFSDEFCQCFFFSLSLPFSFFFLCLNFFSFFHSTNIRFRSFFFPLINFGFTIIIGLYCGRKWMRCTRGGWQKVEQLLCILNLTINFASKSMAFWSISYESVVNMWQIDFPFYDLKVEACERGHFSWSILPIRMGRCWLVHCASNSRTFLFKTFSTALFQFSIDKNQPCLQFVCMRAFFFFISHIEKSMSKLKIVASRIFIGR